MLVVHGGAWKNARGDARRMMAPVSVLLRKSGWRVVDVEYANGNKRAGEAIDPLPMLRDVVAFYDQIRRAFPGPVCAYGESAGGHLVGLLTIERPSLTCAILNAAPVDLPSALRDTIPEVKTALRRTFGTRRAMLDAWSPAQLWNTDKIGTAVFATAAGNDTVVPPNQLKALDNADPGADTKVVPGAKAGQDDAVPWMHSVVKRGPIMSRLFALGSWLDGIVPKADGPAPPATDRGAGCDTLPADRADLLRAGDAWHQAATADRPITATRGCSGSGRWQDDGLSLWALPSRGGTLKTGSQATLSLASTTPLTRLRTSFRGFLARPADWIVGLYASTQTSGLVSDPVATCVRGVCSGLRLVDTRAGALVAPAGARGNPDRSADPPAATYRLPAGTRRLAWRLQCVAPGGCSLNPATTILRRPLRRRDPLGHPAIISVYRVDLR